jgi:hypothetical protein
VYRRDLQLAPITNDVAEDPSNAPVCRAVLKRHMQYKSHGTCMEKKKMSGTKKLGVPANEVLVIDVDAEEEKEHKKKRKTSLFAANVMTSNLTIRMGQMQELKEALNFLDRMRPIIGDEEYAKLAKKYLSFLPDPATFTNEVTSSKDLAMAIKKEPMDEEEEGENDDEDDVELL